MIFVDTWAWLALGYKRDPFHQAASQQHREFVAQGEIYLTTDHVLAETVTALYRAVPSSMARTYVEGLLRSIDAGSIQLVFVSEPRFREAWNLRERFSDKPAISFVDLTSMVVMRDLGISDIFTGDRHFLHVGLGFRLWPRLD
jgi:predicted nucleic acid-binding protein